MTATGHSISIVTPVYQPKMAHLQACAQSVLDQDIDGWEWVIVDDGSNSVELSAYLNELAMDERITVIRRPENGGIVAASNDGLLAAMGDYVALLDQDDVLHPSAIRKIRRTADMNPDAQIIYSDRGHIDDGGKPTGEDFCKPDWSPIRLTGNMYIAHLTVLKRSTALRVGGFRSDYEGSQDHDLVLRVSEEPGRVIHVPEVLYYWRLSATSTAANADAKPYARTAGVRAVQDHFERTGQSNKTVAESWAPGFYQVTRKPFSGMTASIVMPTMGARANIFDNDRCLVVECVRSIVAHEYAVDYEIVIVYDERDGLDTSYLAELRQLGGDRLRLIAYTKPFNFSEKINVGALHARGEVLVVLNDDMQIRTPTWLDDLVGLAQDEGIGAVGCKLVLEDGRLQHSALEVSPPDGIHAADFGQPIGFGGYFGSLVVDHEVVGATGACIAIRRSTYLEVGGFPEEFHNSFNDVDFCFRLLDHGYRNAVLMNVEIYHFESLSRNPTVDLPSYVLLRGRWLHRLSREPYLREMSPSALANPKNRS